MNIENEIFKRTYVDIDKLLKYGFKKDNNKYIYEKDFLNNSFKAIIVYDGNISGKVFDIQMDEEYTNFRTEMNGEFVGKVREEYKNILIDIKNNCFNTNYFIYDQSNRITKYIIEKYGSYPEFLWDKYSDGVFRCKNNNKWFGIIITVDKSKIDNGSGETEIINVKVNENDMNDLLKINGIYKAYHMNKDSWVTIILDDTLDDKVIIDLIDKSYDIISSPVEWIVPANPKYYDIINAFNDKDEIIWKQSSDIHVGDIVYLYVADPYSKIYYKCKATEVNIPYDYKDNNLKINHVMKIKLLERLDMRNYTFEYLNKIGIKTIRGPRKIGKDICKFLNK